MTGSDDVFSDRERLALSGVEVADGLLAQGLIDHAIVELEAVYLLAPALVAEPYARALVRRGMRHEQAGDLEEALADYSAAHAIAPPGALRDELDVTIPALVAHLARERQAPRVVAAPPVRIVAPPPVVHVERRRPMRLGLLAAGLLAAVATLLTFAAWQFDSLAEEPDVAVVPVAVATVASDGDLATARAQARMASDATATAIALGAAAQLEAAEATAQAQALAATVQAGALRATAQAASILATAEAGLVVPPAPPEPTTAAQHLPAVEGLVDARAGWQQTGVVVEPGATYRIEVVDGRWAAGSDPDVLNGGEGAGYVCTAVVSPQQCREALPDFPHGALIGMVGGTVFGIGKSATISPAQKGELLLRINDSRDDAALADNAGALTVRVVRLD